MVFSCYDRIVLRKEVIFTETINDRIRQVRKSLKLNQAKFGEQITLAQTYLSQIERGDREVTEKILKLVCLQFNVSEHWLRTGEGQMFEESSDSLVSQLCEKYKLDNSARILLLPILWKKRVKTQKPVHKLHGLLWSASSFPVLSVVIRWERPLRHNLDNSFSCTG